ncbi:MAG: carboxymuconolactone decarboxylase family protein [Kiritimatiellae bacterium]|nr:carboxymuconolactone decarboxylase family protein [Kiritimatiellia bacterium]MDD5519556.1 carboxymuconolactone decarboxylase family protein [Kiritimatiellia bacterium]
MTLNNQNDWRQAMSDKMKELIAIGASVSAHCQPCLTYHVSKAKDLGVDTNQIRTAIEVGQMVEKGSMSAMREFAKSVLGAKPSITCPYGMLDTVPQSNISTTCPYGKYLTNG